MMKKTFMLSAALFFASVLASAQAVPSGSAVYSLPQTAITFEVEAVMESFFAGPYAKYAQKYLGIDARQQDATSCQLASVSMSSRVEADQSRRYTVKLPTSGVSKYLQLTTQGLISTSQGSGSEACEWRFPADVKGDFSRMGVSSAVTTVSTSLTRASKSDSLYNSAPVSQSIVVAKTLDQKAKEASDMILKLRKTRVQILTGDTDMTYSGQAMGDALEEISRLENEYLTLFLGYSEYQTQKMNYDVVPVAGTRNNVAVAFRISDTQGLVAADDVTGRPYYIDIIPEKIEYPEDYVDPATTKKGKKQKVDNSIHYLIPAICNVKLSDGAAVLMQSRIPIHQFGVENTISLKVL